MASLLQRFQRHLDDSGLLPPGSRVLVAVSGGADSVALLHLLQRSASPRRLVLEAAHLDHALRPDSPDDAAHVRALCAQLQVPLTERRIDVAALAHAGRGGVEEAAREARRTFLQNVAREKRCDLIALAHQRDDQAETFLLRLLRGAGTTGLAGMRPCDPPFVRPLLPFSRDELVAWLAGEGIAWREDPSNRDPVFARNRVRHELLPLLESYNPAIREHLAGLCRQFATDEAEWQARASTVLQQHAELTSGECRFPAAVLRELSPAMAGRVVRAALRAVRGDLRRIEARHIEAVLALSLGGRPQGEVHLPGAWMARRYEVLWFRRRAPAARPVEAQAIAGPGIYPLGDGRVLAVTLAERPQGEGRDAAEFAAVAAPFPLLVRGPRPGDRLRPEGMAGSRKLQDLFVDLKLPHEQRRQTALVLSGDRLLWVAGIRRCAGLSATVESGAVLRLELFAPPVAAG